MLSLVWGIALPDAVKAQDVRPLPVEDVLKTSDLSLYFPIGLSPDAKWLAYTVKENRQTRNIDTDAYAQTGVSVISVGTDIWLTNVETGERMSLTGAKGSNWYPTWSPDGHYIAFLSDRDGSGQARLWVWDAVKKDLRRVSDLNIRGLDQVQWTHDSRSLLVTPLTEGVSTNDYAQGMSKRKDKQPLTTKTSSSGVTFYQSHANSKEVKELPQSDPWDLDWRFDLVMVEAGSGKTNTIVHNRRIQTYFLSPDGSRVAYTSPVKFEKPGSQQILFDLVVVAVATGQERVVASNIQLEIGGQEFRWSPDGSKLVYHVGGQEAENYDCYVVDADGGSSRNITFLPPPAHKYGSAVPLWGAKGEQVYFLLAGGLWRGF